MRRIIWTGWFAIGFYFLTISLHALDGWVVSNAMPAASTYCNGTMLADLALSRAPICVANWLATGKSWLVYTQTVMSNFDLGHIYLYEVLRVVDVLLFTTGFLCFGFALACLWANAMTQGVLSALAGMYTLSFGLTRLHERSRA